MSEYFADDVYGPMRICRYCGKSYPATNKYFRTGRSRGQSYLTRQCKQCYGADQSERMKKRYKENRDQVLARNKKWADAHPKEIKVIAKRMKQRQRVEKFIKRCPRQFTSFGQVKYDGHGNILANHQCSMCRRWYAPYTELWADEKLCAFCREDIRAMSSKRLKAG